jgi:hypothetical protein
MMCLAEEATFVEGGNDEKDLEEAGDVHRRRWNGNVTLLSCPTAF